MSPAINVMESLHRSAATPLMTGLQLQRFVDSAAREIAAWVQSATELMYLAPGTPPPLTADKVAAWGLQRANRLLLCAGDSIHISGETPVGKPVPHSLVGSRIHRLIGYGELNYMPQRPDQMWIGHLIVNPAYRGRGIGLCFTQALLARAFLEYGAAEVLLLVFPENCTAVACYEKCGMDVVGQEHKSFESTGRRHLFLRMSIKADRFERCVGEGLLPGRPLPFRR